MGAIRELHAFPQKDSIAKRVFPDAKLATALFVFQRTEGDAPDGARFASHVHPGRLIEESEAKLWMDGESIRVYDPENLTIVSCTQQDWDLMASLRAAPIARLGAYAQFFQGEVNQTVATGRGLLVERGDGELVTRGANISLYQLREASQGEDLYLDVDAFLKGAGESTKAYHHRLERVALQESSPQNNFRRLIACRISEGHFCNHTINYTTQLHCRIDLSLVLFVLNSAFADWYFRLGSTNAHVSHYQLLNIPCPRFGSNDGHIDTSAVEKLDGALKSGDFEMVMKMVLSPTNTNGPTPTLESMISAIVRYMEAEEAKRGEIQRSARSALSDNGIRCQEILDRLMLDLVGLGADRYPYIQQRLEEML